MSRFQRVVHGAASSYGVLAATAVCSLASIPLALHFLSTKQFALWGLMGVVANYLNLIDLGASSSLARLLIDQKDRRDQGDYGGLIRTGALVLAAQGFIIFVIGFLLAPFFCHWLDIEPKLQHSFIQLIRWQSGILAFGFVIRIFGQLLYAHQRLDIVNYCQIVLTTLSYFALWFFFRQQQGVFSLIWTNFLVTVGNAAVLLFACWKLRLLPAAGQWGKFSWQQFKEIFDYGKDLFLVALGTQLIMASQIMIITRTLGLEMAAVWAIGTKMFNLICQTIWRISDVSAPAFSEMIVRNEHGTLRERYKSMVVLTASLSGFAAVSYALCNSLFVPILSKRAILWHASDDVLLAVWMIILALLHCHNGFVLLTKKIGFMRYIYFVEGIVFVALAFLTANRGGLPAIIGSSIICSVVFSGAYGVWRMSDYLNYPIKEVALNWMKPMAKVLVWYLPIALLTWWAGTQLGDAARLVLNVSVCVFLGSFLFLRHGISNAFQSELLHRAPRKMSPILKRVLSGAAK
jgi:O-antigen/teichoic acid export membrane protein